MVIAYHLIWTAYGWWLPNDPRGSMSRVICCDVIAELGGLYYGRKRIQPASRDICMFYENAKIALRFPLLTFDAQETEVIARAFAQVVARERYTCYACAIMPDHVHLVIRKHRDQAEQMIAKLQAASHLLLRETGLYDVHHPVWGGKGWKVFLDSTDDIRRTIPYVEKNPIKQRLPRQEWSFVSAYDGWPGRRT